MKNECQRCTHSNVVVLTNTGGIFRCEGCKFLNLVLIERSDGNLGFVNFSILEQVCKVANAVVCRAENISNSTIRALKIFYFAENEIHAQREFIRESVLATEIKHTNIVRTYSAGEVDGMPYIELEYVDGVNVSSYIEDTGPIEQMEAMSMASYICDALDYVWNSFLMIHRDIKPQNLLLTYDGEIKVCDFGMITNHEASLVDLGAVEGTPYYLSPECISEGAYLDSRSDIYSLGATLYHIVSGVPPFDYDGLMKVVEARVKEEPPNVCKIAPYIQKNIGDVLLTMMAKDPTDRYVTFSECKADILRIVNGEDPILVNKDRHKANE